jgi:hypothetical protein
MNTAIALIALLIVAGIALAWYSARTTRKAVKAAEAQGAPTDPRMETLRYHVPDAQDPTVLISALDRAGYTADLDDVAGEKHLVIACPAGRDRERARVRSVLGDSDRTSLEGPEFNPGKVTFEDEK